MLRISLAAVLLIGCSVAPTNEEIKRTHEQRESEVRLCLLACGDYVRHVVWEGQHIVSCECYVAE